MVKLKVNEVKEDILKLQELGEKNTFDIMFEFYGINMPKVGDKMLMHKRLLDKTSPLFVQPYAFELTDEKSAEHVLKEEDRDYMLLYSNKKVFVLKRIYG